MDCNEQVEDRLSTQACILIYDGECRLCVSTKQKLEGIGVGQAESEIRFLAYQNETAKEMLGANYRSGRPDVAFLVRPSGEVLQGLEAFLPLVPKLPGGKLLLWWLQFPSAKRLVGWAYRIMARHRYRWFGKVERSKVLP